MLPNVIAVSVLHVIGISAMILAVCVIIRDFRNQIKKQRHQQTFNRRGSREPISPDEISNKIWHPQVVEIFTKTKVPWSSGMQVRCFLEDQDDAVIEINSSVN